MTVRVLHGDCRDVLLTLPADSFDCCVSSPPYWRQRDYGVAGQIGLEETPEEWCLALVDVFREVRRVLKPDGSLWLNVGDKWAGGGMGGGGSFMAARGEAWANAGAMKGWRKEPPGYKDKDLVGAPWMLAFALRADGWWLRQCNIWNKPNCMPESVHDRSTAAHEYVFHLTKSADYYYDDAAARTAPLLASETQLDRARRNDPMQCEGAFVSGNGYAPPGQAPNSKARLTGSPHGRHALGDALPAKERRQRATPPRHAPYDSCDQSNLDTVPRGKGARLRSVWTIAPAASREDHYAMMPEPLAEICIVCGCRHGGQVLDPFGGAGTTGLVADRLGRHATLIELNPKHVDLTANRIKADAPLFAEVVDA